MWHVFTYFFYFFTVSSSDMQPNDSNASIPIDKPEDIQNPLTVQST